MDVFLASVNIGAACVNLTLVITTENVIGKSISAFGFGLSLTIGVFLFITALSKSLSKKEVK